MYFTRLGWLEEFRRRRVEGRGQAARTIGPEALQATKQALSRYVPPRQG
jgi:hypothetical protein